MVLPGALDRERGRAWRTRWRCSLPCVSLRSGGDRCGRPPPPHPSFVLENFHTPSAPALVRVDHPTPAELLGLPRVPPPGKRTKQPSVEPRRRGKVRIRTARRAIVGRRWRLFSLPSSTPRRGRARSPRSTLAKSGSLMGASCTGCNIRRPNLHERPLRMQPTIEVVKRKRTLRPWRSSMNAGLFTSVGVHARVATEACPQAHPPHLARSLS